MKLVQRVFNRSLDYVLFNPWLESFWLGRMRGSITSLLYHQIDASEDTAFLARSGLPITSPQEFRRDIGFLRERGARFLRFDEIAAGVFPAPHEIGIALCFDDCFLNNYTWGLSVLEEFQIKATFFQSTALVGGQTLIWEHSLYWHTRDAAHEAAFRALVRERRPHDAQAQRLQGKALVAHLREGIAYAECAALLQEADRRLSTPQELADIARKLYPSATHLRQAKALGHEIASHGHRHLMRANITQAEFEGELAQSSAALTQMVGARPLSFSYPFDSHLPTDAQTLRQHFQVGATVAKRRISQDTDLLWLPRFTWPGPARNSLRHRRWLLTGTI